MTSQYAYKVYRSIFSETHSLGRVNSGFERCDDLVGFVCTEDCSASYDDIAP